MTGTFSSAGVWMGSDHVVEAYPHQNDPSLYIFAAHDAGATKMSAYRITSPGAVPVWQSICAHPNEMPIDASSISNTWDTAPIGNGYPLTDINGTWSMTCYVGNNYCLAAVIDKMTGTFSSAGVWMGSDHVVEAYPHENDPSLYIFAAHDAGATKMSAYRITYLYGGPSHRYGLRLVWQSIRAHPTSLEPIDAWSISNTWDSAQPAQQNGYPVVDIVVEPSLLPPAQYAKLDGRTYAKCEGTYKRSDDLIQARQADLGPHRPGQLALHLLLLGQVACHRLAVARGPAR